MIGRDECKVTQCDTYVKTLRQVALLIVAEGFLVSWMVEVVSDSETTKRAPGQFRASTCTLWL